MKMLALSHAIEFDNYKNEKLQPKSKSNFYVKCKNIYMNSNQNQHIAILGVKTGGSVSKF
jgi:hypothetical protein